MLSGKKPFELCWDDRRYVVGDMWFLREVRDGIYTGRSFQKLITFKLAGFEGLAPGWCILGLGVVWGSFKHPLRYFEQQTVRVK